MKIDATHGCPLPISLEMQKFGNGYLVPKDSQHSSLFPTLICSITFKLIYLIRFVIRTRRKRLMRWSKSLFHPLFVNGVSSAPGPSLMKLIRSCEATIKRG